MSTPPQRNELSRRAFIALSCQCAAGLLLATPLPCSAAQVPDSRLSLYHTHTHQNLTFRLGDTSAWTGGRINRFLRDFRTGETHAIDPQLITMLGQIKEISGSSGTFEIISGFRSPKTNAMLRKHGDGVAKKSLHMSGRALDIRLSDVKTGIIRDIARSLKRGGVGYYPKSDFVHIDTGRVRSW